MRRRRGTRRPVRWDRSPAARTAVLVVVVVARGGGRDGRGAGPRRGFRVSALSREKKRMSSMFLFQGGKVARNGGFAG
jgi:hypothetical protein